MHSSAELITFTLHNHPDLPSWTSSSQPTLSPWNARFLSAQPPLTSFCVVLVVQVLLCQSCIFVKRKFHQVYICDGTKFTFALLSPGPAPAVRGGDCSLCPLRVWTGSDTFNRQSNFYFCYFMLTSHSIWDLFVFSLEMILLNISNLELAQVNSNQEFDWEWEELRH